jgi:hypothetical protein
MNTRLHRKPFQGFALPALARRQGLDRYRLYRLCVDIEKNSDITPQRLSTATLLS